MNKNYILMAVNKAGKNVYIDEVPNGKQCGCFCKECGGELVAKNNGKIKVHHFAHATGNDSINCSQTALHILAKEIIAEERCVAIPRSGKIEFYSADKVELEKSLGDIIPDVFATVKGRAFMVEILVSHAIDEEKLDKIKEHRISCIEIDLSGKTFESKEDVRAALNNPCNIKIIYDDNSRLIQERKEILLNYGLKLEIYRGGIVICPKLRSYVPTYFCEDCVFGCKENNSFMRCGFILPLVLKPNLRVVFNIILKNNTVMFDDEAKRYNDSHFGWKATEAVQRAYISRRFLL
ncbi:hypothetical protein [Treponema succinifaciens]|uniref:hypothetical protein n=1 Tax=Treponema succinifaciens TaxID=167 RepID=UPI003FCD9156